MQLISVFFYFESEVKSGLIASGYCGKIMAGVGAGFAQGELLGMSANLKTVACILSPLLWSRIYAAGLRRGKAGLWFYTGVSIATVARMLVMRTLAPDPQFQPAKSPGPPHGDAATVA